MNCSVCKVTVNPFEGWLYKTTKYRNSRGYHCKCDNCHTGKTPKPKSKNLGVNQAKKIVKECKTTVINEICYINYRGIELAGYHPFDLTQSYYSSGINAELCKMNDCDDMTTKAEEYLQETIDDMIAKALES